MNTTLLNFSSRVILIWIVFSYLLSGCSPIQPISEEQEPKPLATSAKTDATNTSSIDTTAAEQKQLTTPIEPVVLLVVDDYSIQPAPAPDISESICVSTPNGQGRFVARGVSTDQGQKAHGALVYSEIKDILSHHDAQIDQQFALAETKQVSMLSGRTALGEDWIRDIHLWQTSHGYLLSIAIDTPSWDPGSVVDRIEAVIKKLDSTSWRMNGYEISQVRGYVINMSFALVPCRSLPVVCHGTRAMTAHYEELQNAYRTRLKFNPRYWNELVDRLARSDDCYTRLNQDSLRTSPNLSDRLSDNVFTGFVCELIDNSPGTRRLCMFLRDPSRLTNKPVINVAAAGNGGLPFPFAPGLFPNVISISAEEGLDNSSTRGEVEFSNWGEVKMSGLHPTLLDEHNEQLSGTSFAAPRFSLLAALFLLRSSPEACGRDSSPLDYDNWENLDLENAANRFCEDFIQ